MPPSSYGKQYRIKPRFFIIIALLLVLLIWGVVSLAAALRPPKIKWGRLANDQSITAVVLRDETVVQAKANGKLSGISAEGEAVKRDQAIAMLYTSGYSEKDLENLTTLRSEIKDYQENSLLKNVKKPSLDSINTQINQKMSEISAQTAAGKNNTLLALEKELNDYMEQRRQLMLTIITQPDDPLNEKYKQEQALVAKIDETRQQLTAPSDGLVSFYLDGFEQEFTPNAIQNMLPEQVKELTGEILSKRGAASGDEIVEVNQPIARIVNPAHWYAVILLGSRENPLSEGNTTEVTFDGLKDPVSAKVVKVVTSGRTALVVLEMTDGAQQMLSLRLINGHIGRDITGFLVPLNMLQEQGDKTVLTYRQPQGGAKTIEVTILAKDAKNAVIADAQSDAGALAVGMELVKP